ncbi:hypothetical protein BCR41DRAFT_417949 [Lobosporangium transversale]|uniref:F-box domain-containing protein n=1 Tax=Lobosporangium transversale TaxID=64571 RepID=A0A1Y2H2R8_9FUNG|nr:hypothetical protein BCR41DRAFT_417949 [Lobosporangium transversale]ORZ28838.1 hypothetical protein BCR41DRAFT_417949 [Lobosporangium transversale]|eukprot:XP_021886511.1 hypothetical protein BCR41DRAFT_417949 [Lobosporangium transversale]
MDHHNLNPLKIPEILLLIGGLLNQKDLLNCIRVSKFFHSSLIGLIWRKITITSLKYPASKARQKHKEYIEKITFSHFAFKDSFPVLREIRSVGYGKGCSWLTPRHLYKQIKVHSSILTSFHLSSDIEHSHELWKALLECSNLYHLEVYHTTISESADLFLQVCKRVRRLELEHVTIHQLPVNFLNNDDSEYILPKIHTLRLEDVRMADPPDLYTSWGCLGMLVRRCPELFSLHINSRDPNDYHPDFHRIAFLQKPWTLNNLSDLVTFYMRVKDEDMAVLLRRVTGLRRLIVPCGEFGQLSLQELLADKQEGLDSGQIVWKTRVRRLCETIETLVFNKLDIIDGSVLTILLNCPRLKRLEGLKTTVTEISSGAEWVCVGLTKLDIYLERDIDQETEEGMAKARMVFRQLGKLTQLEYLGLTGWWSKRSNDRETLDLRLRAGLDELVNLKKLRTLWFKNDKSQRLQLEDARWMVNNWPSIRNVNGLLNDEKNVAISVRGFLKRYKVSN